MTGRATYLGIDVGSTATKVVAFGADGTALATARRGYPIHRYPPDRVEQHLEDWWSAADACVAQVATGAELAGLRGIGITGQVDTHVLVDENWAPLRPAIMWQDVRGAGEADALNARLGQDGLTAGWGSSRPLDPSSVVPRALWLGHHEPELWASSRWLLLPKDALAARLTGRAATDPISSFSVVGADGGYVPGIAHAPGLAERLPALLAPEDVVGTTTAPWHDVPAGVPVTVGTMDAFANVLGSGLCAPGDTMVVLGTSAVVAAVGTGIRSGPGVVSFLPYRGQQVHAGPTQSGGDSVRWWAQATGHTIEEVLAAAAGADSSRDVVFAPHLLGERSPLWDSDVRAWFTGIDSGTGFAQLSLAVLEGVAYSVREALDAVRETSGAPTARVVLSGGGSRSPLWCQVVADVTGFEVRRTAGPDSAVAGAAMLAASAVTGDDPWTSAAHLARYEGGHQPDPATTARHDERFALYRDTYRALRPVHRTMADSR